LRRLIRQRAEAYGHGEPQYNPVTGVPLLDKKTNAPIVVPIPGGDTGMVVRQPRTAGVQFSVDGVLLARLSASTNHRQTAPRDLQALGMVGNTEILITFVFGSRHHLLDGVGAVA
jgi:hypothetical protein